MCPPWHRCCHSTQSSNTKDIKSQQDSVIHKLLWRLQQCIPMTQRASIDVRVQRNFQNHAPWVSCDMKKPEKNETQNEMKTRLKRHPTKSWMQNQQQQNQETSSSSSSLSYAQHYTGPIHERQTGRPRLVYHAISHFMGAAARSSELSLKHKNLHQQQPSETIRTTARTHRW